MLTNQLKIVVLLLPILGGRAHADSSQPSIWCGPANHYVCSKEQQIAEQRRQMQRRQPQPPSRNVTSDHQNMARYWELLQRQREIMERQALRPN